MNFIRFSIRLKSLSSSEGVYLIKEKQGSKDKKK